MPSTKSSRSSHRTASSTSRPSLLSSLSSRSSHSFLHTAFNERERLASLGQPEKVADAEPPKHHDESGGADKSRRRKSRLNVLTSFFSPSSTGSDNNKRTSLLALATGDPRRPKTASEPLPSSHLRQNPVLRGPIASALEFSNAPSSFDDSPNTAYNTNRSVSTVDISSDAPRLGPASPSSQDSALDFGLLRTVSPESADFPTEDGQLDAAMPVQQKHQKGKPSTDKALPRLPVARQSSLDSETRQTPTAAATESLKSRRSRDSPSRGQPLTPNESKGNGRARLQSSRRPSSPVKVSKVRSCSAQPLSRTPTTDHVRTISSPLDPRPVSRQSNDGETRGRLRRSWLPGSGGARSASKSGSKDLKHISADKAWVISADANADYNTSFLINGDKVPELWDENGTVLVHLHPRSSNKGPSFKINSWPIEASIVFHELRMAELQSSQNGHARAPSFGNTLGAEDATRVAQNFGMPQTEYGEVRLYLPSGLNHDGAHDASGKPDLQRLIAIRNLFAFLTGQPLVGTKAHPTTFSAFVEISALLKEFDFMSMDGTTWGEAVDMSFGFYMSQLALADVRHSREKTLEALILGERMKCWELYNEAYTHAVGKWQAIAALRSPLMEQISPAVHQRLERANLDLLNRQHSVNQRLEDFEFPALFAGVANSSEFKDARTGRWRTAFQKMRGFTLDYYKDLFGSWPPKARSKKNPFSESGLNRLVLKALYGDLCSLYDLLVDRDSLTPRVIDQAPEDVSSRDEELHIKVLRKVLTEFDTSSPPVLPPVPFDIPKVPTMKTVLPKYDEMKDKNKAKLDKNIKDYERELILHKSYNFDTDSVPTAFLELFKDFDKELAKGKSSTELIDNRMGIWLFLYVVIQSLPLLIIDAPDLQFTDGVEYFLCQPPMGNAPWVEDAGATRKAWYQIPGSSVKVELSPDVVMFSVEATFERSHCWASARNWDEAKAAGGAADLLGLAPPPGMPAAGENILQHQLSPLQPPGAVFEDMDPVSSPGGGGSASPGSSAPGSPAGGPQRRVIAPGSGLAQGRGSGSGYRASFAGLVSLEPLSLGGPSNGASVVDRRASRVYSAQLSARSDSSVGGRPQSAYGDRRRSSSSSENPPGMLGSGGSGHGRSKSSTFDDILKDIGNQNADGAGGNAKSAKKKFGF